MSTTTYEEILAAMQQTYRELSGLDANAAADIGIRLKVLAGQLADLYESIAAQQLQIFPQTATGEALENHAACRGLTRKAATPASGHIRFSREIAAAADIPIPAGVICATRSEPQIRFATTTAGSLPAGQTAVDIAAEALDLGTQGNIGVGAISLMVSAASGITSVSNASIFGGGVDAEDDETLRARLLQAFRMVSNGTNAAFYYDIAMQYDKVLSVQVIPRARGRGTVDIAVHCRSVADTNTTLPPLREELAQRREVGVDVSVYSAVRNTLDISAAVTMDSDYAAAAVEAACMESLNAYMDGLQVGQPLLRAQLIRCLMAVEGVSNANVLSPAADLAATTGTVYTTRSLSLGRLS